MLKVELERDDRDVDSPRLVLEDLVERVLADAAAIAPHPPVSLVRERHLLLRSR